MARGDGRTILERNAVEVIVKGSLIRERIIRDADPRVEDKIELELFSPQQGTERARGCAIEDIPDGAEIDSWTIYFVKRWT